MTADMSCRDPQQVIGEDKRFQHKYWVIERAGWVVGAAIIAAAFAGLTGSGGWFEQREAISGPHRIEYPRAFRWDADAEIVFRLAPLAGSATTIKVDTQFTEDFQISHSLPQPFIARTTDGGSEYVFPSQVGRTGMIVWHVRPIRPRATPRYAFSINGGNAGILQPIILP